MRQPTRRVAFLFLGPASHVAHAASIAFELDLVAGYEVTAFVSSQPNADIIRAIATQRGHDLSLEWLKADPLHRLARLFKRRAYPRVRYVTDYNRRRLQSFDAVVMMDAHPVRWVSGMPRPRMILAGHGAGIRAHGRYPGVEKFDLLLLPGRTKLERFMQMGHVDDSRGRIIGYPKFDLVSPGLPRKKLFANDNPVVVYNPHFNAQESSWPAWGTQVLDYFLDNPEFNLIFAPHMLLFGRKGRRLPGKYLKAKNILVDLDGPALIDMTYTVAADVYLGDVSSQVYEFVGHRPRPCIFLDPHKRSWQSNGNLTMWRMGDVVADLTSLDRTLRSAAARFSLYRQTQERLSADAFDRNEQPAGQRGALAIADLLSS